MSFWSKLNISLQRNQNIKAKFKSHPAWWSPNRSSEHSPKASLEGTVSHPADGHRAKGRFQGHKETLLLSPAFFFNAVFTFHPDGLKGKPQAERNHSKPNPVRGKMGVFPNHL